MPGQFPAKDPKTPKNPKVHNKKSTINQRGDIMKRFLTIITLFFAAAACSAAETLRASLLLSFSPDSQVEFSGGNVKLHSMSNGRVMLAQITRQ